MKKKNWLVYLAGVVVGYTVATIEYKKQYEKVKDVYNKSIDRIKKMVDSIIDETTIIDVEVEEAVS